MKDAEFLQWIYDRLVQFHGEDDNFDYMHKLRAIINATDPNKITPNIGEYKIMIEKICSGTAGTTDAVPNHLRLDNAVMTLCDARRSLGNLIDEITGNDNLPEQVTKENMPVAPSLQQALIHAPDDINRACEEIQSMISTLRGILF